MPPSAISTNVSSFYEDDLSERVLKDVPAFSNSGVYEISFTDVPISSAISQLNRLRTGVVFYFASSSTYGAGVVGSSAEAESPFKVGTGIANGEVVSSPVNEILVNGYFRGEIDSLVRDFCFCNNLKYERVGDCVYISPSDVELGLCYVVASFATNYDSQQLSTLQGSFGSDCRIFSNGSRVVACGRLRDVKMFGNVINELNEVRRSYVATIVFYRCSRSDVARIAADISTTSVDLLSKGWDVFDVFDATLDIKSDSSKLSNYSQEILYCTDLSTSTFNVGSERQRESRAVTDQGTSTVTGYQSFRDGVQMEIKPYRSIDNFIECELSFSNSKFQNDSLSRDQIDLNYQKITFQEGRLYYVASLKTNDNATSSNFLGFGGRVSEDVLTVWISFKPVFSIVSP